MSIRVRVKSPAVRAAVDGVLRQIRDRRPEDHARLLEVVREIVGVEDPGDGTLGEWFPDSDPPMTYAVEPEPGETRTGRVEIVEPLAGDIVATLAHELGHACTRRADLARRQAPTDQLAAELAADWYAYRWGFGRKIARKRRTRRWQHHGPAPGEEWEEWS